MRAASRGLFVALTLSVALLLGCSAAEPDGADEPGLSFYAEIALVVEPNADDPLARIVVQPHGASLIRWWQAGSQRWRWEISASGASIDAGTLLQISDGETLWGYDDRSNSYGASEPYAVPDGFVRPPTFSAPVGPANVESVEAFMEQWRERGMEVQLAGETTLLGRRTQIVEMRPAWNSAGASAIAPSEDGRPAPPA